MESLEKIMTT